MAQETNPKHLQIINRILKHHPRVAEAISVVSAIMGKARFPINSFDDLVETLGGSDARIEFGGRSFSIAELESKVPAYYFPIGNENDLIAKIGDLAKLMPGNVKAEAPNIMHGANINPILMAATAEKPKTAPPRLTLEEMHKAAGVTPRMAPGMAGIYQQIIGRPS